MKCERCDNPATVHVTEIRSGKQISIHLCEKCASKGDYQTGNAHTPINELLTQFVMTQSGIPKESTAACESCGITWAEFRQNGLLGCAHDYELFEKDLTPLLQRAHEGATHHVGKVPTRRGGRGVPMRRTVDLARLRKELQRAVEAEDYERAAELRDLIRKAEGG
ncbi:MAG: UvrB/UvrC motif-containing protein [Tepidisphaerales bacterium]